MRRSFQDARSRAAELAGYLDKGQPQNTALGAQDGLAFTRAAAALQPWGLPVDLAAIEYAQLRERLGNGHTLTQAVDFYLSRNGSVAHTPLAEAADLPRRQASGQGRSSPPPQHRSDWVHTHKRNNFLCPQLE